MRKKRRLYFEQRVKLLQYFLILPLIVLALIFTVYWMQESVIAKLDRSRVYSLQSAAESFDKVFTHTLNLLEKPYTEKSIYDIITTHTKNDDGSKLIAPTVMMNNIVYYERNISSSLIISEISNTIYYKRLPPSIGVNAQNLTWDKMRKEEWYIKTISTSDAVVMPACENELFTNSGLTVVLSQRLRDVLGAVNIGVVRLDLNLQTLYPEWSQLAQGDDSFVVLDHTGQLVYSSSAQVYEKFPLLTRTSDKELSEFYRVNTSKSKRSGFTFMYLTDKNDLQVWTLLLGLPLLVAGLCFGYASLFIKWSARKITRPIQTLKKSMIQGQQKDLSARCEPLDGEMRELSDSFNSLMERTQELVSEVAINEREKSQLSYEILQSKINPHFLYNTLNAIRWKAELIGAKDIGHALESLASLLRFSIKCEDEIIPFETELSQLENYIQIMRVRYGDEVDINYEIDEACYDYCSLKFLIQPAVENCYIHAFCSGTSKQKLITIRVKCDEESPNIVVEIEDNGDGMTKEQLEGLLSTDEARSNVMFVGIGIGNVRQRIRAVFGKDYDLVVDSAQDKYTKVTATIPKIARKI